MLDKTRNIELNLASIYADNYVALMSESTNKDIRSRLVTYIGWLTENRLLWYQPDLVSYRDHLLKSRQPRTVAAHLSTIRGRYKALMRSNKVRDWLREMASHQTPDLTEAHVIVSDLLTRMANATHSAIAPVKEIKRQDTADGEHIRLTAAQVKVLVTSPGLDSLRARRDTALIALMVCTGVRAAEAAALDVVDLRQNLGGELALRVRDGKGGKQRLIPYGGLGWSLDCVEDWLRAADIKSGAVFRGILRGGKSVRAEGMTTWSINDLLKRYPIEVEGAMRVVKPHDLRRTYARNAYDAGMTLERIQQNLGHTSLQTTQVYIGELSGVSRRPPAMFEGPKRSE